MKFTMHRFWILLLLLAPQAVTAQTPPKFEFRGAWVATVFNLDWPDASSSAAQQQELIDLLDGLKAAGVNAVFFQIRSEADAMYASEIEPWSFWLTGEQGRTPDPFYDPLALAVEEAHKRGMELHAWVNPYRVTNSASYVRASDHLSQQHPEWILTFPDFSMLDPGLPEARDYITRVILDLARRYDVDGVHFDDFFYPYPPNQITSQDDSSFAIHHRGFVDRGDWRRDNVNRFIAQVYDSLQAVKPALKFGISPFGIWSSGVPAGIVGLDAVNDIYADALAWLGDESVDYLVPQLYWPFAQVVNGDLVGAAQDYAVLAPWWAAQMLGRHLYTGHALYKADPATFSGTLYDPSEVPNQVRFNRDDPDILGSVFFRARNLTALSSQGFADSLTTDLYRYPALTPSMPWKDGRPPGAPSTLALESIGSGAIRLTWEPPDSTDTQASARRYAVYRVPSSSEPDGASVVEEARNLIAVTGETQRTDTPAPATEPYYYLVTAFSANSIESAPSNLVRFDAPAVAVETEPSVAFRLHPNYPNPFMGHTEIRFTLEQPADVTLRIYDMLGREVAILLTRARHGAGTHAARWNGTDDEGRRVSSGPYFYTLDVASRRVTKAMVLVR